MAIELLIKYPNGNKIHLPIGEEALVSGRSKSCDLQVEDPLISSKHCILKLVEKKVFVMDCGTKNGTFCNGKKIQICKLSVDDVLTIGKIWLSLDRSKMTPQELSLHANPATKKEQQLAHRTLTAFSGLILNLKDDQEDQAEKNIPHISVGKIQLDDRKLRAKQLKANHKERKKID